VSILYRQGKSARLDWINILEWIDRERLNKTGVNDALKGRKARFVVPPLGGSVWYYGIDLPLTLPPKGGTTNRSPLPPGLRREFHLQPLAAARDLDFVFLIGLHLAEGVGVIVDVFDLAPGQLDDFVSGFHPGLCGGRIVADGVEQHPVVRLGVVRHGTE